jgi:uncharacterized protein YecT (DUF1311 family)
LEVFVRGNIADLIDHGAEYMNRAVELSKHLKMDFALVKGIQGRVITLGDIVAHSVTVSSLDNIISHFEILLGKKLRPLLLDAVDRWASEIEKKLPLPIIGDLDVLARNLTRLFDVRHILCHEVPRSAVYGVDEVDNFLDAAIQFTKAIEEVLTFEKFGFVPLTQTDMNIAAGERLAKKEDELTRALSEVRAMARSIDEHLSPLAATKPGDKSLNCLGCLDDAEEKWLLYRKAQCDFDTCLNQGGTIRPLLWASEATRLTESRIAELRSWLKREEER